MKKKIKTRNPIARLIKTLKSRIVRPKKGKGSYNRKKLRWIVGIVKQN